MTSMQFLETAVSLTLQVGLVLSAAAWLACTTRSPLARCRVWTVAHVVVLALVLAGALLPHLRPFAPWGRLNEHEAAQLAAVEHSAANAALVVWLLGACASTATLALESWRVARFLRRCREPAPDEVGNGLPEDDRRGEKAVRVLASSEAGGPFCWQFHRPTIVVPEYVLAAGAETVDFVIRHERAHLRTGHPLQLFLQRIVEILLWFHPLVWWSSRQAALAREFACDEAAVSGPDEIARYLRALVAIVERRNLERGPIPRDLAFGEGPSAVVQRARRLVALAQRNGAPVAARHDNLHSTFLVLCSLLIAAVWVPLNSTASTRSAWTPWPSWSAGVLHDLGVPVRDFETYDCRTQLHELQERELGIGIRE